jgi:hypothetical protein
MRTRPGMSANRLNERYTLIGEAPIDTEINILEYSIEYRGKMKK